MTRRALQHAQVKALRDQGLLLREIAEHLGMAISTVHDLLADPTGEIARERKMKRFGICVGCGCKTYNSGSEPPERCTTCRHEFERASMDHRRAQIANGSKNRHITDGDIFEAIRSLATDGPVTANRYRSLAAERGLPSMPLIYLRFGTWSAACAGAGVIRPSKGPYRNRISEATCVAAVRACGDELGRPPTFREYSEWARQTGGPSGGTIRKRFGGGFMPAVELAFPSELKVAA